MVHNGRKLFPQVWCSLHKPTLPLHKQTLALKFLSPHNELCVNGRRPNQCHTRNSKCLRIHIRKRCWKTWLQLLLANPYFILFGSIEKPLLLVGHPYTSKGGWDGRCALGGIRSWYYWHLSGWGQRYLWLVWFTMSLGQFYDLHPLISLSLTILSLQLIRCSMSSFQSYWKANQVPMCLDDVGCIVWMDSRDIRYKECVNLFLWIVRLLTWTFLFS